MHDDSMFLQTAEDILAESELIDPVHCKIIDSRLYEDLRSYSIDPENNAKFRVFFSADDYDYIEDEELEQKLIAAFK